MTPMSIFRFLMTMFFFQI